MVLVMVLESLRKLHTFQLVLLPNWLHRAARFANFEGILGFFCSVNHLSRSLRKHTFTRTSSKGHGLWFVIIRFRTIWFVSVFRGSLLLIALFRAIIDYFARKSFLIFLILVSCKNEAMSASFPRQKFHSPLRFSSPFSVLFLRAKLGERVQTLWLILTPPPLKWLTEQKTQNPFEVFKTRSAMQRIWQ